MDHIVQLCVGVVDISQVAEGGGGAVGGCQ